MKRVQNSISIGLEWYLNTVLAFSVAVLGARFKEVECNLLQNYENVCTLRFTCYQFNVNVSSVKWGGLLINSAAWCPPFSYTPTQKRTHPNYCLFLPPSSRDVYGAVALFGRADDETVAVWKSVLWVRQKRFFR